MAAARHHLVEPVPGQSILTAAEVRVVRCIADGLTNKEMCRELNREISTIKTHREHIRQKLGCRPANVAMVALKRGVIRLLSVALVAVNVGYSFAPNTDMMRPVRGGSRYLRITRPVVRLRREVV